MVSVGAVLRHAAGARRGINISTEGGGKLVGRDGQKEVVLTVPLVSAHATGILIGGHVRGAPRAA